MRALAAAVIATIAVTGAGTVHAEPRSIHESIGIDTLGSADTSTLSKPTRKNVKDCSEAVADAYLVNAILTGCNLAGANLTGADLTGVNLYGADLGTVNLTDADLSFADLYNADLNNVIGWDTVKGKDTIVNLGQTIAGPCGFERPLVSGLCP